MLPSCAVSIYIIKYNVEMASILNQSNILPTELKPNFFFLFILRHSLSVVINDRVHLLDNQLMTNIFPLLVFEENVKIEGKKRGDAITTM